MRLRLDALPAHLGKNELAALYTIAGDEPLLAIEAADAIRAAARRAGYAEREVFDADARFDWSQLAAAQGLSLFSQRRLLEIRLRTGKPGKEGGAALATHAGRASADLLTIVTLPKLDKATAGAAWVEALAAHGVWIDVHPVERAVLPNWIAERLGRQQQSADRDALEFMAEQVEGNLLAAHQEVRKLALLYPSGALSRAQIEQAVLDVARFDLFALPVAMLEGDTARVLRMIEGLRAEGEPLPLALWSVTELLRTLLRVRVALDAGANFAQAARDAWVRRGQEEAVRRAMEHLDRAALVHALARCAEIDRRFKGLDAPTADSDPWLELTAICLLVGRTNPSMRTPRMAMT